MNILIDRSSALVGILALMWLGTAGVASADPLLGRPLLDRHAERPDAQAGQPNSLSYFERSVVLPGNDNLLRFSYEIDSEPGDLLRVYGDGVLVWQQGGRLQRGRAEVSVCPGAGLCTVKFVYQKNGTDDAGLDTARVDDVSLYSDALLVEAFLFDEPSPGMPAGWSSADPWGGWAARSLAPPRSAMRPPAQAFLGGSGGATTSWMSRTVYWPNAEANVLDFAYFVDSEEGDALRVLIDGVPVWEESGANRYGRARLAVSQGSHLVRFEYAKNGSVDAGLDTARVTDIVARSGGAVVEAHDFRGQALDVASPDWQVGGEGGGWVVSNVVPTRTYVPRQTTGQQLAGGWSTFTEPILDGMIGGDWINATELILRNYGDAAALPAKLGFVASTSEALYVAWRAPATSTALGGESGAVTVYLGGERQTALEDQACSGDRHFASAGDRRFSFEYDSAGGVSAVTIDAWSQEVGDCRGTFQPLESEPSWRLDAEITEPADDLGYLHVELRIRPPVGQTFDSGGLGLGLIHEILGGSEPSLLRYPFRDDGQGPVSDDVYSWETVVFDLPGEILIGSEVPGDLGCCLPEAGLPGLLQ